MHTRNDGKGENNVLQNEFTAYLSLAVVRRKKDLLRKRERLQRHELSTDFQDSELPDTYSACIPDPFPLEFENRRWKPPWTGSVRGTATSFLPIS